MPDSFVAPLPVFDSVFDNSPVADVQHHYPHVARQMHVSARLLDMGFTHSVPILEASQTLLPSAASFHAYEDHYTLQY